MDDMGSQNSLLALAVVIWTSLAILVAVFLQLASRGWSKLGRPRR